MISLFFFFWWAANHCPDPPGKTSPNGQIVVRNSGLLFGASCPGGTDPAAPEEAAAPGADGCADGAGVAPTVTLRSKTTGNIVPGLAGQL